MIKNLFRLEKSAKFLGVINIFCLKPTITALHAKGIAKDQVISP